MKTVKYKDRDGNVIEYVDHIHYPGTKEYGVTLNVNGKLKKENVKEDKIEEYLNKFKMEEKTKSHNLTLKEDLLAVVKMLKDNTITPDRANSIASVANAYTSLLKVELLIKKG